ncbi:hypothetical protein [Pedobacter gandavensis]|uniref:Uncharacterized protein n=1 Tax=Pedobacter gandavensis TaxID=2679963 RepID=A0ABR6EVE2_9SPHI|nr:hypothetical protein [Pedobacter gandavensis]MBB2148784.1 hypothetical protein [Pedobacter gandavensis]
MMYGLKNVSLTEFGFVPGIQDKSNLALSGFLNMPSRLGKTFHDWAGEAGIEPYVSADEIFFGGRDLMLSGFIQGIDRDDCESKRRGLIALIDGFTDLVPLESKWGTFDVLVSGQIKAEFLHKTLLKLEIPFREPQPDLSGVLPAGSSSEFGIDGISFKDLGGYLLELSGDRRTRPTPKAGQFTAYGKEGYQITNPGVSELEIKLFIKQPTYSEFKKKIQSLYKLFASPGLRNLTAHNDKLRSFFVKDGFVVDTIYSRSDCFIGMVTCKLTEAGTPGNMQSLLDDLGYLVTDSDGNTIKIKL